jgi:hypothetical protein
MTGAMRVYLRLRKIGQAVPLSWITTNGPCVKAKLPAIVPIARALKTPMIAMPVRQEWDGDMSEITIL